MNGTGKYPSGVWVDSEGALHMDIPAVLCSLGLEATQENRDKLTKLAMDYFQSHGCRVDDTDRPHATN